MSLSQISMGQLHGRLGSLGAREIVLDVRTPTEFAEGHVPGSLNIPHDQVLHHVDQLRHYERIYLHCRSGRRATAAAEILQSAGLHNIVCIGGSGMDDWVAAGFPSEKG